MVKAFAMSHNATVSEEYRRALSNRVAGTVIMFQADDFAASCEIKERHPADHRKPLPLTAATAMLEVVGQHIRRSSVETWHVFSDTSSQRTILCIGEYCRTFDVRSENGYSLLLHVQPL